MTLIWTLVLLFSTPVGSTTQTFHYATKAACEREGARIAQLIKNHPDKLGAGITFCVQEAK